jgi:hypothetical protein
MGGIDLTEKTVFGEGLRMISKARLIPGEDFSQQREQKMQRPQGKSVISVSYE